MSSSHQTYSALTPSSTQTQINPFRCPGNCKILWMVSLVPPSAWYRGQTFSPSSTALRVTSDVNQEPHQCINSLNVDRIEVVKWLSSGHQWTRTLPAPETWISKVLIFNQIKIFSPPDHLFHSPRIFLRQIYSNSCHFSSSYQHRKRTQRWQALRWAKILPIRRLRTLV